MYIFLIVIHVIVSLFLIAVILLQAGRGGGLADSFGGSQLENIFGTKSTTVLTKLTSASAIIFIITCLTLAIISSQRSRSLLEKVNLPVEQKADVGTGNVGGQVPKQETEPTSSTATTQGEGNADSQGQSTEPLPGPSTSQEVPVENSNSTN